MAYKRYDFHDKKVSELQNENREISIYERNKKIKNNELYDYLWDIISKKVVQLSESMNYKLIFNLLQMNSNIGECYRYYKMDYDDIKVSVWVDYSDFSKIYLQVVRDIEKTYKGDISLDYSNYIRSEKRKNEEASYSLYNYLKKEMLNNVYDLLEEKEDYSIINTLDDSYVIRCYYHDYMLDFKKGVISLEVDILEFTKIYKKVSKEIKELYKSELNKIKNRERIKKQNEKIRLQNVAIKTGFWMALGHFLDKIDKK